MGVIVMRTTNKELSAELHRLRQIGCRDVREHFQGGRDWTVVAVTDDAVEEVVGDLPGGGHDAVRVRGIVVGDYGDSRTVAADGAVGPMEYGGWVEDEASSWILYLDRDKRPVSCYLRRDETGSVIGSPVDLSSAEPSTLEQLLRDTPVYHSVDEDGTIRRALHDWTERERFRLAGIGDDDGTVVADDPAPVAAFANRTAQVAYRLGLVRGANVSDYAELQPAEPVPAGELEVGDLIRVPGPGNVLLRDVTCLPGPGDPLQLVLGNGQQCLRYAYELVLRVTRAA